MYRKGIIFLSEKEKRKLPLLHQDEEWINLYENTSDESMDQSAAILRHLLTNEEEAKKQFSLVTAEKKAAMRKIIQLSDSINNNHNLSDVDLLDAERIRVDKLNYDLDNIQYELETLPKKIQDANMKLLEATVDFSYTELNRREEELIEINREMIEIRDRLRELFERRIAHEEWNEKIYVYLHSLLGSAVIEKIDDENRKDKNDL